MCVVHFSTLSFSAATLVREGVVRVCEFWFQGNLLALQGTVNFVNSVEYRWVRLAVDCGFMG